MNVALSAVPSVRLRASLIRLREDGILEVLADEDAEVTYADAKEHIDAEIALGGNKRRPVLVRIERIKSITREARAEFSSERNAGAVNALALLVKSPVSKMIGNFFIGFNKGKYPTKLFTTEAEALAWLLPFVGTK